MFGRASDHTGPAQHGEGGDDVPLSPFLPFSRLRSLAMDFLMEYPGFAAVPAAPRSPRTHHLESHESLEKGGGFARVWAARVPPKDYVYFIH